MNKVVRLSIVAILMVSGVAWLLGSDFQPWVQTARKSAADQIMALVDSYELKVAQVQQKIKQYEESVVAQAKRRARFEKLLVRLDDGIDGADAVVSKNRSQLTSLHARLKDNKPVYASTGREMSSQQIEVTVETCKKEIKWAEQRKESLSTRRSSCSAQLDELNDMCDAAPAKVKSLRAFCADLKNKLALTREMQKWSDEMSASNEVGVKSPQVLEDELRAIDADIDAEVAGLSALLEVRTAHSVDPSVPRESLIAQIETVLGQEEF